MTMNPALHHFAAELDGLLVFHAVGLRPRGAEDGDLAFAGVGREEPERVAQLAQGGLDDAHVAGVLHVGQEFQGVFDDVGDFGFVVAAAFESDEFLNARLQFGVGGGFCRSVCSRRQITLRRAKATRRLAIDSGILEVRLRVRFASPASKRTFSPQEGSELR